MSVIFDSTARRYFAANYPETPHRLRHQLRDHPLFSIEALARLGEALPAASIQYNKGDLPVGIDPALAPANGLSIGESIRDAQHNASWVALKNIEHTSEYQRFLSGLLAELKPHVEGKTGRMLTPLAHVFVSSPYAVTPYHFDAEHRMLIQLCGSEVITQFPAGDTRFAPDETHEGYHTGDHRNLIWHESLASGGTDYSLSAGQAIFLPFMAPHYIRNGPEVSISLAISWRSEWSFAEADARAFNSVLRKAGVRPKATGRFPSQNSVKALAWRMLRKLHAG